MDVFSTAIVSIIGGLFFLKICNSIYHWCKDSDGITCDCDCTNQDKLNEEIRHVIFTIKNHGSTLEVLGMLPYININATIPDDGSLLHMAVRYGTVEMVEFLIERGANINAVDRYGQTPFLLVCQYDRYEMFKSIIDKYSHDEIEYRGIDPNAMTSQNYTPLVWAVINNNWRMVKCLLEMGAHNIRTLHGFDCYDVCKSPKIRELLRRSVN